MVIGLDISKERQTFFEPKIVLSPQKSRSNPVTLFQAPQSISIITKFESDLDSFKRSRQGSLELYQITSCIPNGSFFGR